MYLYARISTSLAPGESVLVGPFDDAQERAQWLYDTLRSKLRELSVRKDRLAQGIRITGAVLWDSDEPREAETPEKFIESVQLQLGLSH